MREKYGKMDRNELSALLSRSPKAITNKAYKLGLKKRKRKKFDHLFALKGFPSGRASDTEALPNGNGSCGKVSTPSALKKSEASSPQEV